MLTNMLQTPEETEIACCSPQGPDYPYGLRIFLNQASMDKLGLKMPTVGEEFKIQAEGIVVSCNMEMTDEQDMSLQIQITELELTPESAQEESSEQPETLMS